MNYQEALTYIHQTPKFSRELGNRLLNALLSALGNPQDSLRFIHIAGTNGKGSTAAMLAAVLERAGLRTGLFTSPYIERFNERIRVNGREIPDAELARYITLLQDTIAAQNTPVSEFALDTAAAYLYFRDQNCQVVVLETGLGGRLDATNTAENKLAAVITSVGLDHTQYLGTTLPEIAAEKCGIFRPGCPVITAPGQEPSVLRVIRETAEKLDCPLHIAPMPERIPDGIRIGGSEYSLGLAGDFQAMNAATVLETVKALRSGGLSIPEDAIQFGLAHPRSMARFERIGRRLILDGGHNPHAAAALCKSLQGLGRPVVLCTAMMADKDYTAYARLLSPVAKFAVTTQLPDPRCCTAEELAAAYEDAGVRTFSVPQPEAAVSRALELAHRDELICVCGSLYLAGRLRPFLYRSQNL